MKQIPVMVLIMEKHVVQQFKKLSKHIHFLFYFLNQGINFIKYLIYNPMSLSSECYTW
jgi:hypothetical protein